MKKFRRGFTLTEILITAAIVVFLLLVAFFAFEAQLAKGRDARKKSDLAQIKVVVEDYYNDHECYPPATALACGADFSPYLDRVPCDPTTKQSYVLELDPGVCPQWYRIYTKLEYEKDPDIAKVGCATGCGVTGGYNYGVSSENVTLVTGTGGGGTPTPGPGGTNYWGCKSGVCTSISGPEECDPNYTDPACGGQCGTPASPQNECM